MCYVGDPDHYGVCCSHHNLNQYLGSPSVKRGPTGLGPCWKCAASETQREAGELFVAKVRLTGL